MTGMKGMEYVTDVAGEAECRSDLVVFVLRRLVGAQQDYRRTNTSHR